MPNKKKELHPVIMFSKLPILYVCLVSNKDLLLWETALTSGKEGYLLTEQAIATSLLID